MKVCADCYQDISGTADGINRCGRCYYRKVQKKSVSNIALILKKNREEVFTDLDLKKVVGFCSGIFFE